MDWEWYQDDNMFRLFLHLLLIANTEDRKWKGVEVRRGQVVVGIASLSERLCISTKILRTCIDKLVRGGELGKQTTNKYTIITICKYEDYQGGDKYEEDEMGKQRANKGQTKGNKQELKNIRNNNATALGELPPSATDSPDPDAETENSEKA